MTTATVPDLKLPLLANGKRIRFRTPQMVVWGVVAAALGSALVAGVYFGVFQVRWHIGSWQIFYLKPWFDGGLGGMFKSASWVLYRHGERDLLEPAVATMGVKTLLAKPKWWSVRVPAWRLALTPPVLIAIAVALAAGGVWLLDFGLPRVWHAGFGTYHVTAPSFISHSSWQVIVLGILIGLVLHRLWAPCGATIQGAIVDHSVDRHQLGGRIPVWATKPVSPPVIRERWWYTDAHNAEITQRDPASKALIMVIIVACVLLTLLGLLAQHWIGLGHSVPYLAP